MRHFPDFGCETKPRDLNAISAVARQLADVLPNEERLVIVEVGSWTGRSALTMTHALKDRKHVIFCVDHWRGTPDDTTGKIATEIKPHTVFDQFLTNCKEHLWKTIVPVMGASQFWSARWSLPTHMVYIDANHEYVAVKQDIIGWTKHVVIKGIVAGHDYNTPGFPGVAKAVDELVPGAFVIENSDVWWKQVDESLASSFRANA